MISRDCLSRVNVEKFVDIKLITPRKLQRSYNSTVFELSTVFNDIYRSSNFYDIKRGGGCESRKHVSFTKGVLYVLTVVFQYYVDEAEVFNATGFVLGKAIFSTRVISLAFYPDQDKR